MSDHAQVAIVGAGPAGLAAATRLADGGAQVVLLDEGARAGGQIYRQPPPALGLAPVRPGDASARAGAALLAAFAAARERLGERLAYRPDTAVWGAFAAGRRLGLLHAGRLAELTADALIVAPGALERVLPVPGWLLPGVSTVGGAQIQLKAQGLVPGRRVLVAGSGPLLLVLAEQLLAAGAQVAAVVEAGHAADLSWRAPLLLSRPGIVREGLRLRRGLARAGVPLLQRHAVSRVLGGARVEGAELVRLDAAGAPVPGSVREVRVDAVALGWGFLPNTELTRQLGCAAVHDGLRGGWVPVRDAGLRTSLPGVYAAGDGAGIAGAQAAALEGRIAACSVLAELGLAPPQAMAREAAPLRRALRGLVRFQRVLWRMSLPRPGWQQLIAPETVVCRCEDVTRAQVDACLADGQRRMDTLKRIARAGMGFCQGRVCAPTLALLAAHAGATPEQVGWLRARPPLRPLPLGAFASGGSVAAAQEPAP